MSPSRYTTYIYYYRYNEIIDQLMATPHVTDVDLNRKQPSTKIATRVFWNQC